MKLVDYFYYLFSNWIRAKEDWSRRQQEAIERFENKFPNDPSAQYNAYIKWYETNADSWIEKIHAAYYEMLAQFPLTQWNDAIAILDTKDDAGLNEAKQLLNSATIPVPPNEGFSYVPTRGQPLFWTTQLKPTTGFIDFLSDPELQKATLETALLRLEDELMAWRAIIPQVDDKAIQELADNLAAKSKKWREDQKNLRDVYTANAVTAVEIFIDIYSSRGKKLDEADEQEGQKITEDVNNLTEALNQENGQPGDELDWEKIKEAAKKIGEGQDSLNAAQSEMIESGLDLATAATEFLKNKGPKSGFTWLESYISQLETCCARAQEQLKNFSSSANNYYKYLSAVEPEQGKNPNFSPSFGDTAYPSPTSDANASTWTEIKISIDQKQMESTRSLSTFFSELDWGVNLFLGSASGSNVESSTEFAEEFMSAESKIEMGFLAQKILIKREWMKPELFLHTGNMVRVLDKPLSPADQVNIKEISKYSNQDKLLELLSKNSFPSYPVALVVVKDLCVKVTLDASKTKALRDTWDSKKTAGGGLFCFSVSESRAESSENESLNSYAMAGQMILRAPAPQIIGYFVQMLPPDKSTPLTEARVKEIGQAIGFVQDLAMAHRTDPLPKMIKAPAGVN
ncbi:hypothetical protein GCM10011352_17510 [Marinobacterium zhoushanense]|uniref:Uncharacterized protein n=2 Tax=Marinobacterium zhoushanense TaxID=1679163 RepID=A0ABQ1K8J1_9GAMM|nr:hypothetical protein GCM10011352_17510 [Marinobacterium zhoushanense]